LRNIVKQNNNKMNTTKSTPEFIIYKEGVTTDKVTILSKDGEPFDRELKIAKYLQLGYLVFDMNNNPILTSSKTFTH
jgi:hypothetical protein